MKKIILTSAIIFGAIVASFAQTSTSDANLKVILNPVQAIVVNTANKDVVLEYKTIADYEAGVTSGTLVDHLKVYSAGGFFVTASASDLENTGGVSTIKSSTITVTPTAGTENALTGASLTAGQLTSAAAGLKIISSTTGGTAKTFNIGYKGAGAFDYIDKHTKGQAKTEYTTIVTYTIAAQ